MIVVNFNIIPLCLIQVGNRIQNFNFASSERSFGSRGDVLKIVDGDVITALLRFDAVAWAVDENTINIIETKRNAMPPKKPVFFKAILGENTYSAIDISSSINAAIA